MTKKKAKEPRLGECCPVMQLVIQRDVQMGGHPRGFEVAPYFNLKGGSGEALVYKFAKAKKTTTGPYGHGSQYATTIYATVANCPFCGAKLKKVPE